MGFPRRILATLMVSLLLTAPLAAQPTAQQKQQAGDLTKQAIAKSQAGEHQTSIDLYLQAFAIVPLPVLLSNVGAEYQKLDKPVEALKYFCMYLEKDPTGQSASFATAQAKLLQIDLGNEAVTDADVCKPKAVDPDPPVVVAPPPAERPATVDKGGTMRVVGLGVGVAGIVALGVGAYFGFKAKDVSDQISNHPMTEKWPDEIQQLEKDGQAYENKQIIFMAAGGALAVTGTVLYFIGRSKRSTEQNIAVRPTVTPDTLGIALGGGF